MLKFNFVTVLEISKIKFSFNKRLDMVIGEFPLSLSLLLSLDTTKSSNPLTLAPKAMTSAYFRTGLHAVAALRSSICVIFVIVQRYFVQQLEQFFVFFFGSPFSIEPMRGGGRRLDPLNCRRKDSFFLVFCESWTNREQRCKKRHTLRRPNRCRKRSASRNWSRNAPGGSDGNRAWCGSGNSNSCPSGGRIGNHPHSRCDPDSPQWLSPAQASTGLSDRIPTERGRGGRRSFTLPPSVGYWGVNSGLEFWP